MPYSNRFALTLIAILLFALLFNALFPVSLYIIDLFRLDVQGYYQCDPGNDWLLHILPIFRDSIKDVAIRICLRYPIP